MNRTKVQQIINSISDGATATAVSKLFQKFNFKGTMKYVCFAEGPTVPTAGSVGYSPGCVFMLTSALYGMAPTWMNFGTALSCAFYPVGTVFGYGFKYARGPITSAGGDVTEVISHVGMISTDYVFVGHEVSDDTDQLDQVVCADDAITLTGNADPSTAHGYVYTGLRNRCIPEWDVFYAGVLSPVSGDTTAIAFTITGVLATDIALVCYATTDDSDVIAKAVCTANTVTVTASADPILAHSLNVVVLRARGSFKPSHYVLGVGEHTSVADATGTATNDVTVSGAAVGDVCLVNWKTNSAGDDILAATITAANTLTITFSADPSTTKVVRYLVLKAY